MFDPLCSTIETPFSARYGARMGRNDRGTYTGGKLHLRRLRLNSGGYDAGGAYWGLGMALWAYGDDNGMVGYLRALDRAEAKAKIREMKHFGLDKATFHR